MRKLKFKIIANRYKDLIYTQAYYFTGCREDAEDITQEVLLKLWHHFQNIREGAYKAWLLSVTRNLCIVHSRKHRESSIDELMEDSKKEYLFIDNQFNPEENTIQNMTTEYISEMLNLLPEKIKSVMIMRHIQDLKYEDIAQIMNLPINSIKVYIHRGRMLLLKKLAEQKS